MHELDCPEGLRLEELVLNGNPLCKKYEDKTIYEVGVVRGVGRIGSG
jgi:hypothetical protein